MTEKQNANHSANVKKCIIMSYLIYKAKIHIDIESLLMYANSIQIIKLEESKRIYQEML